MRRMLPGIALIILGCAVAVSAQLTPDQDVMQSRLPQQTARLDDAVPLHDWAPAVADASVKTPRLHAASQAADPSPMIAISPCRVVDTRYNSGAWGPPSLSSGVPRTFNLRTNPACPGIPSNVTAYSANITVVNPTAAGWLSAWPEGVTEPAVSTLNFNAGQTVANAAILPAGTNQNVIVKSSLAQTHLIIDVNGYFRDGTAVAEGSAVTLNRVLATGSNYIYPTTTTVTLPNGGQCQVSVIAQIKGAAARPDEVAYVRIAVERGGTNYQDNTFGFYFPKTWGAGLTAPMSRTMHIDVNVNQATRFGCYIAASADFAGDTADCLASWSCL